MSIISQQTWDKFDPTEQKEIRELYSSLTDALKQEQIGSEEHLRLSSLQDRYISLFGKESLQPKSLTYEDVARELFVEKKGFYIKSDARIDEMIFDQQYKVWLQTNNCTSRKQAEKLLAINKLLNVAAYLNKNEDGTPWKPDWENMEKDEKVWTLGIGDKKEVTTCYIPKFYIHCEIVYFRTEELAKQAVTILGENTVRLALTTEY